MGTQPQFGCWDAKLTRRGMLQLGAASSAAVWLSACGGSGPEPAGESRTLRVAYPTIGANRNPPHLLTVNDLDIADLTYDSLLTLSADLRETRPRLAESHEVIEPDRWRFSLRSGVRFHDGQPVRAEDVKASLEGLAKTEGAFISLQYQRFLKGVEIVDDRTVDVIANAPYRPGISVIAYASPVVPAGTDPHKKSATPVGSGPYKFVEYVPNNRIVLEANGKYWGSEKPAFEQIIFRMIPEDATRLGALETGEIDVAWNAPPDAFEQLKGKELNPVSIPSTRPAWLTFNFHEKGPWENVQVRQALNHAVDKETLHKTIFGGLGDVSRAPESTVTSFVPGDLPQYEYDPDKARAMLRDAGYPDGFDGGTLGTSAGRFLKDRETTEAVHGQLQEVGARYKLQSLEFGTFVEQAEKFQLGYAAWGNLLGDPATGVGGQPDDIFPWTFGGWEEGNAEFKELIQAGNETFDKEKLTDVYGRLLRSIWNAAPRIFLVDLPSTAAHGADIGSVELRPNERIDWNAVRRD